ncbi:CoA pyrophosphatase [Taibaiella lutea]|uniref:CoA pyrophosphatase n=1 Tax=Taibaiella lutea TaxID=2608001 RepID=A0A5M6CP43_9BACT|nr:CoA pyrophosphatase [Taibaiella lutea]KAA5536991.1 CoA pyrophosphatase [Taibaiella lutea]
MNQWIEFKKELQEKIQQPLPGYEAQRKMMSVLRPDASQAPENARQSGVLLLLYPTSEDIKLVLIERSNDGGVHSGQLAFPGGKKEETDNDIIATALREANEEISLKPGTVTVLGRLSSLYIPVSNFVVNPVMAICDEEPVLVASDYEVANILRLSIYKIFSKKEMVQVLASGGNLNIRTIAYMLDEGKFIWGATAMILSELETMLAEL